ncbi:MAG: hypothetical protein IT582_06835 [Opitutaceae bacterium]|nr:hypothetical protein [Opitutaceae bacterium]
MADYLAKLQNCVLPLRTQLDLNVVGFVFELHQDANLPPNRSKLRGIACDTTEVWVRNVAEPDRPAVRAALDYLIEMLSFATESRVALFFEEYPAKSGLYQGRSTVGTIQVWRPPFDDNVEVKKFIEQCYPQYVALRAPRQLHVVIDYIHHSVFQGLAEEVKIALACVTFECLRDNWARADGYPHINGYFREKGLTGANPPRVGIERHLSEMFRQVGVAAATAQADAKRIVDIRNEVLHTGLFQGVNNHQHFEFLETTLRTYVLRLLGYTGRYFAYVGGTSAPLTI